ncbi:MAG: polysaccharide deacetylase family protein [Candidatus Omnitrophica bacterium]|nr:polysaccharide deacetylase family protein [Candidatus Omnitrophota bacterium]
MKPKTAPRPGVLIILYHRVNDELPENALVIRTERFAEQMAYLKSSPLLGEVISLRDWEERPDYYYQLPNPAYLKIIITFDDGYRDNFTNAFPVLRQWNLPASFFLATGMIDTGKKFARYAANPERDMLNLKEIAEMADQGMTFGPHTQNHVHLTALSPEEQQREIHPSCDYIQEHIAPGSRLNTFCYPYGEYNSATIEILRAARIRHALTVRPGKNTIDTPSYELRRVEISGIDSIQTFKTKLTQWA